MDLPEKDEFVVVRVTQILDYGVFVEILDYNNLRGFVHISNVSSSWVKNIRNLVKMNQVRVSKVLNVDIQKKQIDLSFAGISPQMEKQKMTEFKQVNREEKLIALLAKQEKKEFDETWKEVADPLIDEYGSLYKAFEKISLGADVSKILDKKWIDSVKDLVLKNIVVSKKVLRVFIEAKSMKEHGLENIKELFKLIEKNEDASVIYGGAGQYILSCSAPTFKEAEKMLKQVVEQAGVDAKKLGVNFSFKEEQQKQ